MTAQWPRRHFKFSGCFTPCPRSRRAGPGLVMDVSPRAHNGRSVNAVRDRMVARHQSTRHLSIEWATLCLFSEPGWAGGHFVIPANDYQAYADASTANCCARSPVREFHVSQCLATKAGGKGPMRSMDR